jgi:hypothetical protein
MSYLPPDQTNQNAPQGQTTNAPNQMPPQQTGGSVGAGTGATKAGAAPNTGTPAQFGSSASKLGDYLTANAPQITQQANNIAGGLNNQYGQVNADVTSAANNFDQSVQSGYTAPNSALVDQAAANPTSFVSSSPNNVSQVQSQYNDAYTGPTSYESTTPYQSIQNEVSNAVTNAGTLGTQTGLQNYLQTLEQNPTNAESTLDTLLVNGNPQANQTVQNAANQFQNLTPQFQNSVATGDANVAAAQAAAQQAAQYAQGALSSDATNLSNTLNADLTNATNVYNTQQANNNASQAALSNGDTLTSAQAAALGMDPAAYTKLQNETNLYDTTYGSYPIGSLAQYLTTGTMGTVGVPTLANTASAQDYATAAALSQLEGSAYQDPLSANNIAQAGTANTGFTPGTFDLAGAQAATANKFSNEDLSWLLGTNAGPTDALRAAAGMNSVGSTTPGAYNAADQAAAAQEQQYLDKFGAGYYPNVNQQWVDALSRLAANPY